MIRVNHGKEIVLRAATDLSALNDVARVIADHGFNILAINVETIEGRPTLRLITDDNLRVRETLMTHRMDPVEEDVVIVELPNTAGALRKVTSVLAREDLVIERLYATVPTEQPTCMVVVHCGDDRRALVKLREQL